MLCEYKRADEHANHVHSNHSSTTTVWTLVENNKYLLHFYNRGTEISRYFLNLQQNQYRREWSLTSPSKSHALGPSYPEKYNTYIVLPLYINVYPIVVKQSGLRMVSYIDWFNGV